jgi:superfamily II DNA helicase RecQ
LFIVQIDCTVTQLLWLFQSFDRPNLKIVIKRKPKNGPLSALDVVVKELFQAEGRDAAKSTIVYCATRREVDTVANEMIAAFSHKLADYRNMSWDQANSIAKLRIKPYHAGFSHEIRKESHLSFLVGKTPVIVATVAFGMGEFQRYSFWIKDVVTATYNEFVIC